ncbi:MAG: hypothetical protein H6566_26565 [Lewinellaceae bacterium]|nr:hypothetical protein [Lewinellaceae bacterium]
MGEDYYKEKLISLFKRIFIETGDARSRIINCEDKIFNAQLASNAEGIPVEVRTRWEEIWNELNLKEDWYDNEGRLIQSSLNATVKNKRNKSMEKYLLFFLEEFFRVI